MQQEDIERIQGVPKCIEAFRQDACHVLRDHDKKGKDSVMESNKSMGVAGPRFMIYNGGSDTHPLDTLDRREMAKDGVRHQLTATSPVAAPRLPEHIVMPDNGIIPLKGAWTRSTIRSAW